MKTARNCLLALLLASPLVAQNRSHGVIERLTSDLTSLSSVQTTSKGVSVINPLVLDRLDLAHLKATVKGHNPDLDGIMQRLAADAAKRYDKYVIPWSLAYVVTSVLAGKDLPRHSATLLSTSIIAALDGAFMCRRTATPLRDSPEYRSALTDLRETLLSVRVAPSDMNVVIENLITASRQIVDRTEFEPISSVFQELTLNGLRINTR